MSTASEIERISSARNKLRAKAVSLGIGSSGDKLDAIADEFDGIANRGAVAASVRPGESYTIPRGFHNGEGTVQGQGSNENHTLQSKTIVPTKSQQKETPASGYYGFSDFTVEPIPDIYQDVSSVTAAAGDVRASKIIVLADGSVVAGSLPDNGKVTATIDGLTATSYNIPAGIHSAGGTVSLTSAIENALAAI